MCQLLPQVNKLMPIKILYQQVILPREDQAFDSERMAAAIYIAQSVSCAKFVQVAERVCGDFPEDRQLRRLSLFCIILFATLGFQMHPRQVAKRQFQATAC